MRVKNKSDLSEFPDGGRATLVRRYSPTLTHKQLLVLQSCPDAHPHIIGPGTPTYGVALILVRCGLLERNIKNRYIFRVTEAGAEVVSRWKAAGFLP